MSALWTAQDLVAATGGMLRTPFGASGVSIDTRTLKPGDLFVALLGESDGHRFVAAALARGAAGAMVHALPEGVPDDAPLLAVPDTLAGLAALGRYGRERFAGKLLAVTGSVGKTTSKEMLRAILAAHGSTWAAEASHNNHWGLPLTLARIPRRAAFCVAEIGMNHAGEIAPLARLARPHVALVTSVERVHVGHLGSIEAIADEKLAIQDGLEPGGMLVLPRDSAMFDLLAAGARHQVRSFGADARADDRLVSTASDPTGCDLTAEIGGTRVSTRLAAPGAHMALNAVGAMAAACALGADPVRAAAALAGFAPVAGRGARRMIAVAGGEALLLDESYNASAVAVRAALAVLAMQTAARRVAVLGDMRELGEIGPAEHAGLAAPVADAADIVFTCGPLMQHLRDALPEARRGAHAADSAALAPIVAAALRPGDAVLVKGSLGSKMKAIVDAIDHPSLSAGSAA
jgi:UDP-N-acetylmuramoyl-tripeptide--D-alanyl-D-alanine ligase